MNTASKNEMNVEAPVATELPLIEGKLTGWKKHGLLAYLSIAKFYPAGSDSSERWIPGMQFRVRHWSQIFTLQVERYLPAKQIPWQTFYTGSGATYRRMDVLPRTIPHVVVVRVLGAEATR